MSGTAGFHEGELEVQERAGVRRQAARLASMLEEPDLDGGGHAFLANQTFTALTGRDSHGELWTTVLVGPRGFLDARGQELDIRAPLRSDEPLASIAVGAPIGLVAIDFAAHRRMRVNGILLSRDATTLHLEVDQAFGNCPQYIQQRDVEPAPPSVGQGKGEDYIGTTLRADQRELIRHADTFFLGTTHPTRGVDASHRGGPPGFVRIDGDRLWWPDYPGNNMFNSFGNLAVDPTASVVFVDFGTGVTLHLSGTAYVEWTAAGIAGDDGHTGRRVVFDVLRVVQPAVELPLRSSDVVAYPRNPPTTN